MPRFSPELLQELIDDLNGTAQSIAEALPTGYDENDLTQDDHAIIDDQIFKCATCDWWFEVSEQGGTNDGDEPVCEGCN